MAAEADLVVLAREALLRGDFDMIAQIEAALKRHPDVAELYIIDAEARVQLGLDRPLAQLDRILAANETWVEGQRVRAALLWEMGAGAAATAGFQKALARDPHHAGLWNGYIAVLAAIGDQQGAANAARTARAYFDLPILAVIEASHAGLAGDVDRAATILANLPDDLPDRVQVDSRQAIRLGRFDAAEQHLANWRLQKPEDLSAWALTELVWRRAGDPRSGWLSGDPRLVGQWRIELDAIARDALAAVLRGLHRQRHAPLGQSVRGGTQTRGPLFARSDPAIAMLRSGLQKALDAYRAGLPTVDLGHPLLCHRDRALRVSGGWSVRLIGGGRHVAHIHPAGIVSSACYIIVPAVREYEDEGALELGCAPEDLNLDIAPLQIVRPVPMHLVLFPSFLYHGTRPFAAGERLTVAFDANA